MREIGSLAVTTRAVVHPGDGAESWAPGTMVRIDHVENAERRVYRAHRANGQTAEVDERSLRDVQPEDDEGLWQFQRDDVPWDETGSARTFYAEKAGTILRSRAPFAGGPDVTSVILLAAYMENGLSPEMVERFEESLRAALERVQFPVRVAESEPAYLRSMSLPAPLHTNAGSLREGDITEHMYVLDVNHKHGVGSSEITFVQRDTEKMSPVGDPQVQVVLKSTPIEIIARVPA